MKRYRPSYLAILLMPLVIVMLTACQNTDDEDEGPISMVNVGDKVPEFVLSSSEGGDLSSSSLSGQVYILNFFDTGCPDCQKELPVLQQLYNKYKGTVMVVNVPRSQSMDEVRTYWDKERLTMPVFAAHDKDLYYKFARSRIPRTYVVNSEGRVSAMFSDSPLASFETLDTVLQGLLKDTADNTVNLSLTMKVAGSREKSEQQFFKNEYAISHLEVFFFDATTRKLVTKSVIDDLPGTELKISPQYDITYFIKSLRLKVGIYNIFVIANYENFPDDMKQQDELINLVDSVTFKTGIIASIPHGGPVMTSRATALLSVDLTTWSGKDYFLTIEMERVMAKLQIGVARNTFELIHDGRKYAGINITNYKLVNLNKQFYLFQHKDQMSALGEKPDFRLPDHFTDYDDEGEQYVVDPLFYLKKPEKTDIKKFGDYYGSWFGDYSTKDFASMPAAENYGYIYVLENTTYKSSQKNGYSPGIVFKAAVNPVFVYLYDTRQRLLKDEHRPEYWPDVIYLYNYNFYGSIQAINVQSGLMLDELKTYTDDELKVYGIKQCKFNMGVYETFYTYWIRHRGNTGDPMGPMQYGIVRNNFYRMIITGINGIGHSEIIPDVMRDNYPNSYVDVEVK